MFTVSGSYLQAIADWLTRTGYGRSPLFQRIQRIKADQVISVDTADELLREAAAISGDQLAALSIGTQVEWRHLGAIGHMLGNVQTLEELLQGYLYYESLFYGANIANVRRSANDMALYWDDDGIPANYARFAISTFLTVLYRLGVSPDAVSSVMFPFDDHSHLTRYRSELGCNNILFNVQGGIAFRREALNLALQSSPNPDDKQQRVMTLFPELQEVIFAVQLYDRIVAALPRREARLGVIAQQLAMSPRTLQRRLEAIPDGYREVLLRVRMHLARTYLRDKNLRIIAVSLLLGYREQSAFQLAFKRQHGKSPGQWRREVTDNPASRSH